MSGVVVPRSGSECDAPIPYGRTSSVLRYWQEDDRDGISLLQLTSIHAPTILLFRRQIVAGRVLNLDRNPTRHQTSLLLSFFLAHNLTLYTHFHSAATSTPTNPSLAPCPPPFLRGQRYS